MSEYSNEYHCTDCDEKWDEDGEQGEESQCCECSRYIKPFRSFLYGNGQAEDDDGE